MENIDFENKSVDKTKQASENIYVVTESYYDERGDFKVLKAFKNIEDAEDFVRKLNEPTEDLSLLLDWKCYEIFEVELS
jgi:hypothetical protein